MARASRASGRAEREDWRTLLQSTESARKEKNEILSIWSQFEWNFDFKVKFLFRETTKALRITELDSVSDGEN